MKRKVVLILILIVIIIVSLLIVINLASNKAVIEILNQEIDLGRMAQGSVKSFAIVIRNRGNNQKVTKLLSYLDP